MAQAGITDSGLDYAANIAKAAAVAVAVVNTTAAIKIASDQEKIAKDYLNISKSQQNYYYEVYVPCEDKELEEACSAELYEKHESVQIGRMKNSVRNQFSGVIDKEIKCSSRYCTGRLASIIKDRLASEAAALATAANLAKRYEEDYADAQDDLRWARRSQALARGRDMMAQAVSFSGFAYGLFGKLGDQAQKGAAGAMGYLGYASARNPTEYPQRRVEEPQKNLGIAYPVEQPQLERIPMGIPVEQPQIERVIRRRRIRG